MAELGPESAYHADTARLPDDAEAIVGVWSEALGHAERRPAKLAWFYASRRAGMAELFVLRHDARVVGVTGIGQRVLVWREQVLDAALMGDFAVDSRHRTLYPALLLQRTALAQGLLRHVLLYGFPNTKSLPVVRRVGYQVLPGLVRHARVLRSEGYLPAAWPRPARRGVGAVLDALLALPHLGARLAGARVAWLSAPDARFDELWQRARGQLADCVVGVRDRAFLQWRFAPQPWRGARLFAWLDASGERLLGYAACETDGQVMHVRDLLVEQAAPWQVARLLRLLAMQARAQGLRSLSLQCSGPAWLLAGMRAAGLRARETADQPMILALGPRAPGGLAEACWYLTRADVDE